MEQAREIRVTLTEDEFVALQRTVSGELESLTQHDWDSGVFDALDAAHAAMNRAWARYMRRRRAVV